MIFIEPITKKNKLEYGRFKDREWAVFNKERGYKYKKKKYEFIAKKEDEVLGIITLSVVGGVGYIGELIVKKSYRDKGIGRLLIRKLENVAKKQKCHFIYLETSDMHKEAIRFYEKEGFKRLSLLPNFKFRVTWYIYGKEISK